MDPDWLLDLAHEATLCLCRTHHLFKTHAGWSYRRARDGTYVWTSPRGLTYLVTTDGHTHSLGLTA